MDRGKRYFRFIYLFIYLSRWEEGGIIALTSTSYISNLKSFALIITIGESHVILLLNYSIYNTKKILRINHLKRK